MRQNTKQLLESELLVTLLWGVAVLSLVFAGAYTFRYRACLTSQAPLDPNSLIQAEPNEVDLKGYVAKDQKVMDAMQADNLIAKAPPKTNPVTEVDIIGQEALINGKLYKVGDTVGDAKITAITARNVTVEWNGASTTFSPINGQDQGGPSRGSGRPSPGSSASKNRPKRSVTRSVSVKPPRAGMRVPSREDMERFKNMSPDERKAAAEEWMKSNR